MNSVLFVCTANRFRSPLASAIFLKLLVDNAQSDGFMVNDAGTWTEGGGPVTKEALVLGETLGVDLSLHLSQVVNSTIIAGHNLIIVMETGHKEALVSEFPDIARKVFVLTELDGGKAYDIPDPYILGEDVVEIFEEIRRLIMKNFDQIIHLSRG